MPKKSSSSKRRAARKIKPQLVIEVDGGIVSRVWSNTPIDVTLVDHDNLKSEFDSDHPERREAEALIEKLEEDPLWKELPY